MLSTKPTRLELSSDPPSDVAVGDELRLKITVRTDQNQDVHAGNIEIVSLQNQEILGTARLADGHGSGGDTDAFIVKAPTTLGRHDCMIRFAEQEIDGYQYGESTCQFSFETRPQRTSLMVWGAPSLIHPGERFRIKVGAKSISGWDISGAQIEVRDATGTIVGSGKLSEEAWAATALKWTELELSAPQTVGKVTWEVALPFSEINVPHTGSTAKVTVTVVSRPTLRLGVRVTEQAGGDPLADVSVGLGPHRGKTDSDGLVHLDVSDGTYTLTVWKSEYEPVRKQLNLTQDEAIEVALRPLPEDKEPWERSY